ncbi:hypothetical protein HMPREF9714_02885 [Myroides odoratimimus CCUG 12901]|uniref:hypothetical protein n=1 Tax=Myroides odoratimimus TaxID=76832 RepID=UPI0002461910|nr:hypothetical protein [Myroides odoratimimus]EHO06651.1 hypothetical protein HMPREF9714_02885 [Myroides odoratimimus CCUG 12901]MDM1507458.1 hypothetical protein [Myroides odoratimimus]MDM1517870.1 hypothetical protein [Myroides odoratimimus]
MGWFTVKPNGWEAKKGWSIILSVICPVLTIFSLVHMAIVAKMTRVKRGVVSILLFGAILLLYTLLLHIFNIKGSGNYWLFDLIGVTMMLSLIFYPSILMAANTREFIQRQHLSELFELEWKEYDYHKIIQEHRMRNIKTISDFICELEYWDTLIVDEVVSMQVQELVTLMKKIDELKAGKTRLFLERHSFSLSNLLKQFHQVELSKLMNPKIVEIKKKLEDTLFIAIKAIRQEVINEIKQQNLTAEIDADLYVETLRRDGLL